MGEERCENSFIIKAWCGAACCQNHVAWWEQ